MRLLLRSAFLLLTLLASLASRAHAQPSQTTQRPAEPFTPSRHGLAFTNHFTGSSLPPELRDADSGFMLWARSIAQKHGNLPDEFGLCGGMSLLAADYYLAAKSIPDSNAAPEQGTPLYDAIYQRQRDSLGPGAAYILKFAHWMTIPDTSSREPRVPETPESPDTHVTGADERENATHAGNDSRSAPGPDAPPAPPVESTSSLTRLELPAILQSLERNELVPLGLVLTRAGRGRLWNNHQVLAYALERLDDATLHIRIYDPNYPADDNCILRVEGIGAGAIGVNPDAPRDNPATLNSTRPGNPSTTGDTVRITRIPSNAAPRNVRGLFPMPYTPTPPAE